MATIDLPKRGGECIQFKAYGKTLEVTKLRPYDYFAKVVGEKQGRFGNADEIREDIEYFLEGGTLPRGPKSSSYRIMALAERGPK